MTKVLIVEDDAIIGEMLSLYLREEQYTVHRVESLADGLEALGGFNPDIILLDLILPDGEGPDLCVTFRRHTRVPIIVISMKTKVSDRIQALTAGADDYLCKPFSMQELHARIETVLRRVRPYDALLQASAEVAVSSVDMKLDSDRRTIVKNGVNIETTFSEYEIMKRFFHNPGKVFSRDELINAVRGIDSFVNERAIDVHVTNLRKKIEDNPREPRFIKTVWGVGYKFML